MPYTLILLWACILVGFYRTGKIDKEIGNPLGLATGALVLCASLIFRGGYLEVCLYAVAGLAFLTVCKIVRRTLGSRRREQERDAEQPAAPDGEDAAGDP